MEQELVSMSICVDHGFFCCFCNRKDEPNCVENCNAYLSGQPKKKREVIEDERSN